MWHHLTKMNDKFIPGISPDINQDTVSKFIPGVSTDEKQDITNKFIPGISQEMGSILNSNTPWDEFKNTATRLAKENDFPVSVLLGQASLESGRGTSNFAKNRNNYFGYMAYDSNPNLAKSYASPEDSIMDYINLIKNTPRYAQSYQQYLNNGNPLSLLQGIRNAGYATDPDYVTKVINTPEFKENL